MTTVTDPNVFNLAIQGTFDDGQAMVKEIFGDVDFKQRYSLGAVNSINWARVLAQVVYYFHAWGAVQKETGCREVSFSVPTGNFGDIFAGYVAKRMGLPIRKLILATNENNILTRFINQGDYSIGAVRPTPSPSMDIQKASNFERYLFYLYQGDAAKVIQAMEDFATNDRLEIEPELLQQVQEEFASASVDNLQTSTTIRDFHAATGYILAPHTATGVRAGKDLSDGRCPMICLATAHPAKFGAAVQEAIGENPEMPESLQGIEQREKRCEVVAADTDVIKAYLADRAL